MRIEASWVAALSDDECRRQIARCDDEIQRLESRPDDVDEPAYLVTIGIEDWRAERRLLEAYEDRS